MDGEEQINIIVTRGKTHHLQLTVADCVCLTKEVNIDWRYNDGREAMMILYARFNARLCTRTCH